MSFELPPIAPITEQVQAFHEGRRDLRQDLDEIESRMARHAALNPIAWFDRDRALQRIEAIEAARRRRADGSAGPVAALSGQSLAGVFVSIKDLYAMPGTPLRAGTRAPLPDVGSTSAVVERLEAAGAIVFAKTQMH